MPGKKLLTSDANLTLLSVLAGVLKSSKRRSDWFDASATSFRTLEGGVVEKKEYGTRNRRMFPLDRSLILLAFLSGCSVYEPKPTAGFSAGMAKVISENCVGCHAGGAAEGGLSVIDDPLALVAQKYVNPGDASSSLLFQKISADPPYGSRMPFGGPYLKDSQIAMVREWIEQLSSAIVTIESANVVTAPSAQTRVAIGQRLEISVETVAGYELDDVGGTCPAGEWREQTYITGEIAEDCTVGFSASGLVRVSASGQGITVQPSEPIDVRTGTRVQFTVKADGSSPLSRETGGSCPKGEWSGDVYVTGVIAEECEVIFVLEGQIIVSASGAHLSVTPSSVTTVVGSSASFSVAADAGYTVNTTVAGTCPIGSWNGNTYSTGTLTATCSVQFTAQTSNPCPTVLPDMTFSQVSAVMTANGCTGCHNADESEKAQFAVAAGDPPDRQSILAGTNKSGQVTHGTRVNPPNQCVEARKRSNPPTA